MSFYPKHESYGNWKIIAVVVCPNHEEAKDIAASLRRRCHKEGHSIRTGRTTCRVLGARVTLSFVVVRRPKD